MKLLDYPPRDSPIVVFINPNKIPDKPLTFSDLRLFLFI